MKIYVASSWRNIYQPNVVRICRDAGHEAYDYRNPAPDNDGFRWSEIDPTWQSWDFERYRALLAHPVAERGFKLDMDALRGCDACLLVHPCGRSAHLELGWAAGAGKRTAVLWPEGVGHPTGPEARALFKGHTCNFEACAPCGDLDGCHLPGKLHRDFEPELMIKMADVLLSGRAELDDCSAEVRAECERLDTILKLQVYPDTPIGSYSMTHYDLATITREMREVIERERSARGGR
jgi:hypothetical protein